ncbi:MAG: hypothetical protein M3O50_12860 [Myxococcota bacterium]|nr:hypothetical protein [Myxococcota bacterium]
MSWSVSRSQRARHLVLRASGGEVIPDALTALLREERVVAGWLRGNGLVEDVQLRAFDAALGASSVVSRIAGPVPLLCLEGSIGTSAGEAGTSLRALLVRPTDRGPETIAGEIATARAIALDLFITSLEDVTFGQAAPWAAAVRASDPSERGPRMRSTAAAPPANAPMPTRPARARGAQADEPMPETGDFVDHFAFGLCQVLKTDGDRIHLRVGKEGRVREIAMEMLRVSRLPDAEDGTHQFKLERRM